MSSEMGLHIPQGDLIIVRLRDCFNPALTGLKPCEALDCNRLRNLGYTYTQTDERGGVHHYPRSRSP
jgi:hypothetical protein